MLPGARQVLRRIGTTCDVVTYLGDYTRRRLAGALGPHSTMARLAPGVDVTTFRPDADGRAMRTRYGLGERPVVVCVSRLVPRKGQDALIRALPAIRRTVPDVRLLLVGGGPYREALERLAERSSVADAVVFTGAAAAEDLPALLAAGTVFCMPCRTRRLGMDVEGLGIVYLEASATGLPVVAGRSGGAPDAVRDGRTGLVVDGRDTDAIARRVSGLLLDRDRAALMGATGRAWVQAEWTWEAAASTLAGLLDA